LLKRTVVDENNNRIQILIKEGQSMWINENIVQFVLDMPTGSTKALPIADSDLVDEEYKNMYKALMHVQTKHNTKKNTADTAGTAAGTKEQPSTEEQTNKPAEQHTEPSTEKQTNKTADGGGQPSQQSVEESVCAANARLVFGKKNIETFFSKCNEDDVKPLTTTDMLAGLYLGMLLEQLLLPTSSAYISLPVIRSVYDLEKLKDVDWAFLVFDCLKKSCNDEKTKNRCPTKSTWNLFPQS
jgi:hypothetical protein